ncbi:MAG: nucleotide exchange factor GrpE [Bacteroidota bacterium]
MIKEIDQLRAKVVQMAAETVRLQRELELEQEAAREQQRSFFLHLIEQMDLIDRQRKEQLIEAGNEEEAKTIEQLYAKAAQPLQRLMGHYSIQQLKAPVDQLPEYSEVLATEKQPQKPDGSLIRVQRLGYLLGDQLLRPTGLVVVKND